MEAPIRFERSSKRAALFAALSLLSVPRGASAEESSAPSVAAAQHASLVVTRGEGAEDCPNAATLVLQVQRVAGASVMSSGTQATESNVQAEPAPRIDTYIQVAITRGLGGYRAEINAGGRHHGTRTLEDLGPGCSSLTDAVVITLAIFLDPYSATSSSRPEPPPSAPVVPPAPKKAVISPIRTKPHGLFDLLGGVSLGMLAEAAPLIGARFGLRFADRYSLALGAAFVFPDAVSAQGGTVDLGLSYVTLLGCARSLGEATGSHLDFCVAPLFGSMYGAGRGYQSHSTRRSPWSAIAAGPELVLPFVGGLSWTMSVEAALPLIRPGFDVEGAAGRHPAFKESAAVGSFTLGVRGEL